ncbi:MFS transporter [Carbonactinospora thermoautotrophica]|uniref:MFS transporter n=1 Tax=Carbonactinospora thermoautotrophica TaxID=1469144 RepID=UPI0022718794|nr:MFS transporter [Carbonactinospora thermoautotrophica]MCX9190137.1 MFS transporter [Carbonactinospora thermoautotrophica]
MTATTTPETELSEPPRSVLAPGHRWLTFGTVSVIFLIAFEAMAVGTAMPVAAGDLGGVPLYGLAFSAYLTASLFGMVWAGQVSDRSGPLLPAVGGVVAFGTGLVIAGVAGHMLVLVAGRAVQGLGGGLAIVALYVVVARAYPEQLRPKVFSAFASAWVVPSVAGPALSGWVAEHLGWRWVFLTIPVLVVPPLVMMWPRLRDLGAPGAGPAAGTDGRTWLALGAAVGVALLQYAGQERRLGGLVALVVAVVLLALTVPRLLPPGTLRAERGLPTIILMRGVVAASFMPADAFVPLMLVTQHGQSALVAGMALTGGAVTWSLGSWYQSRSNLRYSRQALVRGGFLLVALGLAGLIVAVFSPLPFVVAAASWVVAGFGMGIALPSVNVLALGASPPEQQGANSAALQVSDAFFSVVFTALNGSLFSALHTAPGQDAGVFSLVFAITIAIALTGAALAPRMAVPRHDAGSSAPTG